MKAIHRLSGGWKILIDDMRPAAEDQFRRAGHAMHHEEGEKA